MHDIASLIQLSVAPIFLLTAVANTLLVFAGRLARIVDRGRYLERADVPGREPELDVLRRRARLIYWALALGVCAALFVCMLMTAAFVGSLARADFALAAVALFLAALFSYIAALLCLLREVFLAVGHFRLGLQKGA